MTETSSTLTIPERLMRTAFVLAIAVGFIAILLHRHPGAVRCLYHAFWGLAATWVVAYVWSGVERR